jgi:hypothetical protein
VKNPKGSKSARKQKPATTETSASEIVTAESKALGTVTIPDAPPAPKPAGRKRKPEPTVATKAAVPEWAKRAAARDTAAEIVAVPDRGADATSKSPDDLSVQDVPNASPLSKKGRARPKARPKTTAAEDPAPVKAGSLRAIGAAWIESLRADGHSVSTVASYGMDLEVAYEHLGADTTAAAITERQIAGFNTSKGVMKKRNGKPRAMPTILKTRRALRLALTWAEETKLIPKAPYSAA